MKRILPILALAAVSSFAGGLKYGVDAAGLLTMPSYTGEGSMDTKLGFGGKIAGAVEYGVSEQFAVRGTAGYALTTWGLEAGSGADKTTLDCMSQFVTVGADAVYAVAPSVQLIGGLGVDIPVAGTSDNETTYTDFGGGTSTIKTSGDIEDTQASVFVEAGLGYAINPALSVNAKYKFALTEYVKDAVKLNQVQVGVSYNFGN